MRSYQLVIGPKRNEYMRILHEDCVILFYFHVFNLVLVSKPDLS